MNLIGPKSIKHFLPHFFNKNREQFNNKIVLDIPAGEGVSSKLLQDIGAQVIPFDLFPEFFKVDGLSCRYADLNKAIPVDDAYADFILCQEGIEHLPNQLSAFQEMNRALTDVKAREKDLRALVITAEGDKASLNDILSIPLDPSRNWSAAEVQEELDNNCQGILGYVVRWVDLGVTTV